MEFEEIKQEADKYFSWEGVDTNFVTRTSAILFADQCVKLALKREAEKDKDDGH
jgi:hypothetical protein